MGEKKPRPLNPRQERFCREYVIDVNGAAAYLRAYPDTKSSDVAGACAARLLADVRVSARVAVLKAESAARLEVKADDVLRELLLVARSDIGEVMDFGGAEPRLRPANEIPENARRAIASIKVRRERPKGADKDAPEVEVTEFRFWPKVEALGKLAQHLELIADTIRITGGGGADLFGGDPERDAGAEYLARRGRALPPRGGEVPGEAGPPPPPPG